MKRPTVSLKQAQKDPEAMKQFIKEHEGDEIESADFDAVVGSMLSQGKPTTTPEASS